jgi:hypothetical protein
MTAMENGTSIGRRTRSFILALGLALAGVTLTSCYGSFGLTHKLHRWNGGLGGKFVRWLVFLGLVIIPVYEISLLVDALILNSLEFWGEGSKVARVERRGNTAVAITSSGEEFEVVPIGPHRANVMHDGKLVGVATVDGDGQVHVVDQAGRPVLLGAR